MSVRHANRPDGPPPSADQRSGDRKLGRFHRSLAGGSSGDLRSNSKALLLAATSLAAVGAVLVGAAPLAGIVQPDTPPGFLSWPLLLTLAGGPPVLAAVWLRAGRHGAAAGILVAPMLLAAGRLVIDLQLTVQAGLTARPALLLPHDLDPLTPAVGLWLLLAGHGVISIAGLIALRANRARDGATCWQSVAADHGVVRVAPRRQGLIAMASLAGVVAGLSVVLKPFGSDSPYLVPHTALDASLLVLIGTLVVALGVPVTAMAMVSSTDTELARGGLLGLAFATAGVVVPAFVATAALPLVHAGWSSLLGLSATAAVALASIPAGWVPRQPVVEELRLPVMGRLLTAAGLSGAAAGMMALSAAWVPRIHMPQGVAEVTTYSAWLLFPAGALLVLLGGGLLAKKLVTVLRPALVIAWVMLPLVAASVLDTVLAAVQAAGASVGGGMWLMGVAVLLAALAAVFAALAGAVERDDVDLSAVLTRRVVLVPSVVAALLASLTFGLPVVTAPGYAPPGIVTEFSITSWGLWAALIAVVAAAALAPSCRPRQVVGLLGGAVAVVVLRVLELPLTAERAAGSGPGLGLWFGLACAGMLVVAAAIAASPSKR